MRLWERLAGVQRKRVMPIADNRPWLSAGSSGDSEVRFFVNTGPKLPLHFFPIGPKQRRGKLPVARISRTLVSSLDAELIDHSLDSLRPIAACKLLYERLKILLVKRLDDG